MRYLLLLLCLNAGWLTAQTTFTDITDTSGLNHQFKVLEGMFGGGACVLDFNGDGFEDVYVTGGTNDDQLLRNNGDGTLTDVYAGSGLELTRRFVTQGVSGADVNRDGHVDLFVTTITARDSARTIPRARNLLFLANGDGTFKDATDTWGLTDLYSFSTGGHFGDFNADGWPDLFVGNYFIEYEGKLNVISDATIVGANQTAHDYLLLNDEGKGFIDVSKEYGVDHRGFGFGGVFTDYDNDGDQDLIVNNDFGYKAIPSLVYRNNYPRKSFTDVSEDLELDLKINAMGAAVGDYNADGQLDYYMTNIRFNRFMVGQGIGKPYVNLTKPLGMNFLTISWGANFADYDHDGDLDLYVSNGDLNPNCVPMANFYFDNIGGKFRDAGKSNGGGDYGIGRGSVTFDLENDGDLDLLALQGTDAEKNGLGSRVTVFSRGKQMIREVDGGGSSHLSQNSNMVHFGLGKAEVVDSVLVTWTGGKEQLLTGIGINQLLEIVERESSFIERINWWLLGAGGLLLIIFWWWFRRDSTLG